MKKAVYILMLAALLLQSGGLMLIYQARQYNVRYEMKEHLNDHHERIEKLQMSVNAYHRAKVDAHEILVNGMMYDVVSVTVTNGVAHILAINDHKEKSILTEIKNLVTGGDQKPGDVAKQIVKLLTLQYVFNENDGGYFTGNVHDYCFPRRAETVPFSYTEISSPPPELG